jgi:hypothetical protein
MEKLSSGEWREERGRGKMVLVCLMSAGRKQATRAFMPRLDPISFRGFKVKNKIR